MNQIKIKRVFVILFILINLFMGYLLYQSEWKESSLSEEAIGHTISVLKKKNILLEQNVIPRKNQKMREVSVKNIVEDSSDFVASLKAKGWEKTEDVFSRQDETITFAGSSFEYSGNLPLEKGLSGEKLSREVQKTCEQLNLNSNGMKLKTIEQIEQGMRLEYVQTYEGYEIFGTKLTVSIIGNEIKKVTGIWTEAMELQSKRQDTLFATEALIRFAEDSQHQEPLRITEIQCGYYISELNENVSHKVMQMIPGFQVTTASGSKYYYDARSPQQ